MKAIRFHDYGGPEVYRLEEVPVPEIQPDQVLIRVEAAGVNYIDIYQRQGLYKMPLPFGPGIEGAGVLAKAGAQTGFKEGTRVAWTQHPGAYAEFAAVPAWKVVVLPDGVDSRSAAAALAQGITAQYLCESTYPAQRDDIALVHAGAGGVGLLLIQLLKQKGATVYTTVSTPEKAALAREAGADETILYTQTDFAEAVKQFTKGKGVHVVYDSVGLTTYEGSLNVLRPLGMLVLFGQSSGAVPPIDPLVLSQKGSLYLTRPSLAHYVGDPASFSHRATKVLNWVAQKTLQLRIGRIYPLAKVVEAHRDLESRKTIGKLVVEIS
ncbi:MAG: quinone oxidoreductase [Verrucomicrobia bacterium]|nr:quinone oxidoreductase [Verrucomicrobiota bacterium]